MSDSKEGGGFVEIPSVCFSRTTRAPNGLALESVDLIVKSKTVEGAYTIS